MKPNCLWPTLPVLAAPFWLRVGGLTFLTFFIALGSMFKLPAADVTWTGGTTLWRSTANWNPAVVPTSTDNAIIGSLGGTYLDVDMGATAAAGLQAVGCVTLSSAAPANRVIKAITASGVMVVYGVGRVSGKSACPGLGEPIRATVLGENRAAFAWTGDGLFRFGDIGSTENREQLRAQKHDLAAPDQEMLSKWQPMKCRKLWERASLPRMQQHHARTAADCVHPGPTQLGDVRLVGVG